MFKKILLSLLLIVTCACSEEKQESVVKIAISPDYPPFEYKKDGKIIGFDIDLANKLMLKLGKKLEITELEFSSLIPALQSGKVDMIMSGVTITPERAKNIDFSDIYYQASLEGLALPSQEIKSTGDLANKKIGAQLGSFMEMFAKKQQKLLPGITVVSLGNNLHLLQELKLGRIDILLLEIAQIPEFLKTNPELVAVKFPNTGNGYAIGFKKGSELKIQINQALESLKADGSLDKLENIWFGK